MLILRMAQAFAKMVRYTTRDMEYQIQAEKYGIGFIRMDGA